MSVVWDIFWCKVFFKEYIKHYRKMTDEQIVKDVRQSMDDLEDLVDNSDSFGSQMVRWSVERAEQPFATAARENGKKGGRPRKKQDIKADAPSREDGEFKSDSGDAGNLESATSATPSTTTPCTISADGPRQAEARQSQGRTGGGPVRGGQRIEPPVRSLTLPTTEQLYDFARAENLDEADARDWYEMTVVERAGKDRYGKPIGNWKVTCRRFCEAKAKKRSTQK